MSYDVMRLLQELRPQTEGQGFILPRLNRWENGVQAAVLRTFCLEHRLPSVKFHTLRACFGTQLLRQGIAAVIVMKIAGWKDLKTMQRYIRLAGVEVAGATDKLSVLPPGGGCGKCSRLQGEDLSDSRRSTTLLSVKVKGRICGRQVYNQLS